MSFNKYKGFSLVEVIIIMAVVSVVLAVSAPILTKRMKNSQTSGCIGGTKNVKKIFINDDTFTVPKNVTGKITFTIIGAGGSGRGGRDSGYEYNVNQSVYEYDSIVSDSVCTLGKPEDNGAFFYTNVVLNAAKSGQNASLSAPGVSGEYVFNYYFDAEPSCSYSYYVNSANATDKEKIKQTCGSDDSYITPTFSSGISGEVGTSGETDYLSGGYPKPFIFYNGHALGMGQGCVWDGFSCAAGVKKTGGGCQLSYRKAFAGAGGGAGAYAKFSLKLDSNVSCTIEIGRGGVNSAAGGDTKVICNGTTYVAGGGGGGSYSLDKTKGYGVGGDVSNNLPTGAISFKGQDGGLPMLNSTISGGSGGSVYSYVDENNSNKNVIYSEGAKGGCDGSLSSNDCYNSRGQDGISPISDLRHAGSGGGGGSCSNDRCDYGGNGADGVAIIEYKTKCY